MNNSLWGPEFIIEPTPKKVKKIKQKINESNLLKLYEKRQKKIQKKQEQNTKKEAELLEFIKTNEEKDIFDLRFSICNIIRGVRHENKRK